MYRCKCAPPTYVFEAPRFYSSLVALPLPCEHWMFILPRYSVNANTVISVTPLWFYCCTSSLRTYDGESDPLLCQRKDCVISDHTWNSGQFGLFCYTNSRVSFQKKRTSGLVRPSRSLKNENTVGGLQKSRKPSGCDAGRHNRDLGDVAISASCKKSS